MYYLYVIQEERDGFVKIGRTMNIEDRLKQLQIANPVSLSVLYKFKFNDPGRARNAEEKLHKHFKHTRFKGEWFKFTKYMENFFSNWDGDVEALDISPRYGAWNRISAAQSHIFHEALECCDTGNYPEAEGIIEEMEETLDGIRRMIPSL